MSISTWFVNLLKSGRTVHPEAAQIKELTERITTHADILTAQLRVYERSRDPCAAMLADVYNNGQISRLHRSILG